MTNALTAPNSLHASQLVPLSPVFGSEKFNPDTMTPEALMFYLSSRMGSLDDQMDTIFKRQQTSEKVRSELGDIQNLLNQIPIDTDDETKTLTLGDPQIFAEIEAHIDVIAKFDENRGEELRAMFLETGHILKDNDMSYSTLEVNASKQYLELVGKDLEAGSQMDMIQLQSLMGARQTAIQLSTNLIAALSESQKAIVGNIR